MKPSVSALMILVGCLTAFADWEVVDDFSQYANNEIIEYPFTGSSLPMFEALLEPTEPWNTVGMVYGWLQGYRGDAFINIPLPSSILESQRSTLFLRFKRLEGDLAFCLSPVPSPFAGDRQNGWEDMQVIIRTKSSPTEFQDPTMLQARGEVYLDVNEPFYLVNGVWYKLWLIVQSLSRNFGDSGFTQGYEVYLQGPDDLSPKRLNWGEEKKATVPFRNPEITDPLETFVIAMSLGQKVWVLDDIYFTNRACLADPTKGELCENWCRFPVLNDYADSADWLGWLYVSSDPWIYSVALGKWLYIPECPTLHGGWVYVSR